MRAHVCSGLFPPATVSLPITDRTTRRRLLTAGTAASLALVAGCLDGTQDPGEEPDAEGPEGEEEPVDEIVHEDPEGGVEIVDSEDGDEVESPVVVVELGVEAFELEAADEDDLQEGQGHHHVLVDREPIDSGDPIPHEEGSEHLVDGVGEIELDLEPAEYDLVAQFADGAHIAYDATDEVSVEVAGGDGDGTEPD